jgi:hypothetical protein
MTLLQTNKKVWIDQDKDNVYAVKNNPITQSSTNVISNSCTSLYLIAGEVLAYSLHRYIYFAMALDPPERKTG